MFEEDDFIDNITNGSGGDHQGGACPGNYCVDDTLFRKIMGTIVFFVVWPFVVLHFKWFPIGRPAAALAGGAFMVIFLVVPPIQAYAILGELGNLQTLCLLVGMMLLSYYYDREGMLQMIALWIFGKEKPFKYVLWKICVLSAVLSAIITNDANCLVVTPLILKEHMKQGRPHREIAPLLLGIATSSNIGSASTFFGNPQNAFIAANSKGEVSLLIFFCTGLPAAVLGMFLSVGLLYLYYLRTVCAKLTPDLEETALEKSGEYGNGQIGHTKKDEINKHLLAPDIDRLSKSREELALSYDRSANPHLSSQIAQEREKVYSSNQKTRKHSPGHIGHGEITTVETSLNETPNMEYGSTEYHKRGGQVDTSDHAFKVPDMPKISDEDDELDESNQNKPLTWRQKATWIWMLFITAVLLVLLAVPPPPTVSVDFNLGLVPCGCAVLTMIFDTIINKKYAFDAMVKIDWTVIMLFVGFFLWLGGFENTHFPRDAFYLMRPYMDLYTVHGILVFTLFVIIGSNLLSNVPLVILIVDQLFNFKCGAGTCSGQLVGVLLAWVSTIAGNFTLLGSVANLIVAEKGFQVAEFKLTFWTYFKFGFVSTLVVLFAGLPVIFFPGDNISI